MPDPKEQELEMKRLAKGFAEVVNSLPHRDVMHMDRKERIEKYFNDPKFSEKASE